MPIIVSDKEGKEPMVVLPLEVYEALVEGGGLQKTVREPEILAELSTEERFYIEPLEEGRN